MGDEPMMIRESERLTLLIDGKQIILTEPSSRRVEGKVVVERGGDPA